TRSKRDWSSDVCSSDLEADRFTIMAMDLASGARRELCPDWDRSAANMRMAADGRHLYVTAPERMQTPLFCVAIADGSVTRVTAGDRKSTRLNSSHVSIS